MSATFSSSPYSASNCKTIKGFLTHDRILTRAADIAADIGLEALTFGRLASELDMSKSGVFLHFGSKRDLQLEILEYVWQSFRNHLAHTYSEQLWGAPRLLEFATRWVSHVSYPMTGGFLLAASTEYDHRPGDVRDRVRHFTEQWLELLEGEAKEGLKRDHFKAGTDPHTLVFEIRALANQRMLDTYLLGRRETLLACRRIERVIRRACSEEGRRVLAEQRRREREYWRS